MPELNVDEFLVLEALETVYKKNRMQFTNDMLEWAPNQFEPIDRRQWLTETELMQLLGSKLLGKRFHDAVFAVSETLEAAQRQEFSGIDPGLGNMPFAIRVSADDYIEYLDQSFKVVSKKRLGKGQSWNSIDTHERLRILPRGLQLLREFRRPISPDQTLVNAKRLASFVGCGSRTIRNALAHCPRVVDASGTAGHVWKYCDALHVLSTATSGCVAKVKWPDSAKDLVPSKKKKSK